MNVVFEVMKMWWIKKRANAALERVAWLERQSRFIDPFFLGSTKYETEKEKHQNDLEKARAEYDSLKQYL